MLKSGCGFKLFTSPKNLIRTNYLKHLQVRRVNTSLMRKSCRKDTLTLNKEKRVNVCCGIPLWVCVCSSQYERSSDGAPGRRRCRNVSLTRSLSFLSFPSRCDQNATRVCFITLDEKVLYFPCVTTRDGKCEAPGIEYTNEIPMIGWLAKGKRNFLSHSLFIPTNVVKAP